MPDHRMEDFAGQYRRCGVGGGIASRHLAGSEACSTPSPAQPPRSVLTRWGMPLSVEPDAVFSIILIMGILLDRKIN
jgi:hypothetical protein